MPETCVPMNHCGTENPVWLGTPHPPADGQVHVSFGCINRNLPNTPPAQKCCDSKIPNIKVKNCGSFYVYHLHRMRGCNVAYCAG